MNILLKMNLIALILVTPICKAMDDTPPGTPRDAAFASLNGSQSSNPLPGKTKPKKIKPAKLPDAVYDDLVSVAARALQDKVNAGTYTPEDIRNFLTEVEGGTSSDVQALGVQSEPTSFAREYLSLLEVPTKLLLNEETHLLDMDGWEGFYKPWQETNGEVERRMLLQHKRGALWPADLCKSARNTYFEKKPQGLEQLLCDSVHQKFSVALLQRCSMLTKSS